MKLGRKGFMLAEVVVVAVVIATVLVTLFTGLKNVSSAYETRNRYYDVDSLYVAMEINDILVSGNSIEMLDMNNVTSLSNNYISDFESFYESNIKYNINSYFVPYRNSENDDYTLKKGIDTLKNMDINSTFKDYMDYLIGNLNYDDDFDYIIVVERENVNNKDDCYYYALKLKY